ncbi:hypothetical protein BI364_08695 [Acidihalobacter yilgarnensis]|uniref:Uncharacterized protein n=1 Tax=Acidihalobacter yilgarnensis TaxID=2819280 RepID=A0A1D8INH5_9GAMM|nr:hypothetical protein [Acidihalobacter yilgarnensis]AOU98028.1 hypothetical protein BI364_08695 [Acidihalobacter yilgarnensis]
MNGTPNADSTSDTTPLALIPKGFNRSFEELKVYVGLHFTITKPVDDTQFGKMIWMDEDQDYRSREVHEMWPVGSRGQIEAIKWSGYGKEGGWWLKIEKDGPYEKWEAEYTNCRPDELFNHVELDPPAVNGEARRD